MVETESTSTTERLRPTLRASRQATTAPTPTTTTMRRTDGTCPTSTMRYKHLLVNALIPFALKADCFLNDSPQMSVTPLPPRLNMILVPQGYMKQGLAGGEKGHSLGRSQGSLYGNKEELYDRLKRHAYQPGQGKKGTL